MSQPYYNDQAHIAQEFSFVDEHTAQTARLAFFKINSYKLSLIKSSYNITREELTGIIQKTLLNYIAPSSVLSSLGFFSAELDN
jgi:hypothetical protein